VTITRSGLIAAMLAAGMLFCLPAQSLAQKKQRDKITRPEIEASAHRDLDLYQVVRALRPHFLEAPKGVRSLRGNSFDAGLTVFVDGKRETGMDALRLIAPLLVEEVRYMDPTQSATEYGPRVNGGALLIKMRKAEPADVKLEVRKDSLSARE
jgi:hypothetical protein